MSSSAVERRFDLSMSRRTRKPAAAVVAELLDDDCDVFIIEEKKDKLKLIDLMKQDEDHYRQRKQAGMISRYFQLLKQFIHCWFDLTQKD